MQAESKCCILRAPICTIQHTCSTISRPNPDLIEIEISFVEEKKRETIEICLAVPWNRISFYLLRGLINVVSFGKTWKDDECKVQQDFWF